MASALDDSYLSLDQDTDQKIEPHISYLIIKNFTI